LLEISLHTAKDSGLTVHIERWDNSLQRYGSGRLALSGGHSCFQTSDRMHEICLRVFIAPRQSLTPSRLTSPLPDFGYLFTGVLPTGCVRNSPSYNILLLLVTQL